MSTEAHLQVLHIFKMTIYTSNLLRLNLPLKNHQSPFAFVLCHEEAQGASFFFQERALIPKMAAKETHKMDKHTQKKKQVPNQEYDLHKYNSSKAVNSKSFLT